MSLLKIQIPERAHLIGMVYAMGRGSFSKGNQGARGNRY